MKKTLIFLLLLTISCLFLSGQEKDNFLIAYEDSTKGEYGLYGYQSIGGKIVIEAQYPHIYTDTLHTTAMVVSKDYGIIAIDRDGNFLLKPFIFDNGPDYLSEGLFRFVENEKMGFADVNCNVVIPAIFDFAEPFGYLDIDREEIVDIDNRPEKGLAQYYRGGYRHFWDPEHWSWKGWEETGYVNKSGIQFSKITKLIDGKREAWTVGGEHVLLDEKGEITHIF